MTSKLPFLERPSARRCVFYGAKDYGAPYVMAGIFTEPPRVPRKKFLASSMVRWACYSEAGARFTAEDGMHEIYCLTDIEISCLKYGENLHNTHYMWYNP